jgi:hypothetical protein
MAEIIEAGAKQYKDYDTLLPALSVVFLGIKKSGPGTLWAAKGTGCAGIGKDTHDCTFELKSFSDTGFHSDFRDGHNQPFHLWGYIAETASPGNPIKGSLGIGEALGANVVHELGQSVLHYPDNGWGTSWQDYTLSGVGMKIGSMITAGLIQPNELGGVIRSSIGPSGPGSLGFFQFFNGL